MRISQSTYEQFKKGKKTHNIPFALPAPQSHPAAPHRPHNLLPLSRHHSIPSNLKPMEWDFFFFFFGGAGCTTEELMSPSISLAKGSCFEPGTQDEHPPTHHAVLSLLLNPWASQLLRLAFASCISWPISCSLAWDAYKAGGT